MPDTIEIFTHCDPREFLDIVRVGGLRRYNMEKTGGKLTIPDLDIIRVARNQDGHIVGGAQGCTFLSSLEVEVLWVHDSCRGRGLASRLLAELEDEARAAGCKIAHLTTYSFQAPGFYQKQGYQICGEIAGFPDDIRLYVLKKEL